MSPVPLPVRLRYLARRAGWPALAGLALLGAAAAMQFGPLPAAQEKLAGLRAAIGKARAHRNAPERATADAASLLAALPSRDTLESSIAAIHHAATAQGLVTTGAEYRSHKESGGEMLRYEISLPLRGGYTALRGWLAELRTQQPALAIDQLSLHRTAAETDQLEGRLRLALFLRARPSAAAGAENAVAPAPTLPTPQFATASGELFATHSWQPPPPPPPPARNPTAPPLPFKYTGKLIEDKTVRVFLTQGNVTTLVAPGDKLGNYDIVRVTTASVVVLFRPLQEKQTLHFGGYD